MSDNVRCQMLLVAGKHGDLSVVGVLVEGNRMGMVQDWLGNLVLAGVRELVHDIQDVGELVLV